MVSIQLDPSIERRLARIANEAGVTPAQIAEAVLLQFIEESDDARIALERSNDPGKRWPQEDLESGLDLEN